MSGAHILDVNVADDHVITINTRLIVQHLFVPPPPLIMNNLCYIWRQVYCAAAEEYIISTFTVNMHVKRPDNINYFEHMRCRLLHLAQYQELTGKA